MFLSKKLACFRQGPAPSAHGHFVFEEDEFFRVSYKYLKGVLVVHVGGDDGEGSVGGFPD